MQFDPRYADHIYGRIYYGLNERGRKVAWLQYWFFYYYNDYRHQIGGIKFDYHEGDWEMIQIALDSNAKPISALYAQHDKGSQCLWNEMKKAGPNNDRPVVYVARGSHASYLRHGRHSILGGLAQDVADGRRLRPEPKLELITDNSPSWINWPGRWGSTQKREVPIILLPIPYQIKAILLTKYGPNYKIPVDGDSPRGPKFQLGKKWKNPQAFSFNVPFDCK